LSLFEIMYGHPFLTGNLSPTDLAPLVDYLPYLNLLREGLREHADKILPHPSKGPPYNYFCEAWGSCSPKGSSTLPIGASLDQTSSGHPHNTYCCQAQWDLPVAAPFKDKTLLTNLRLFHYSKG
jgi:hypothetical protein